MVNDFRFNVNSMKLEGLECDGDELLMLKDILSEKETPAKKCSHVLQVFYRDITSKFQCAGPSFGMEGDATTGHNAVHVMFFRRLFKSI